MAYVGNVLSAIITYGTRKQPIPPIPSIILRIPKKMVEETNGAITPADPTNNMDMKKADRLPQWSEIIPNTNAPISIPTMYNALKMPFM